MSPGSFILLFLCAGLWTVFVAAGASLLTLWSCHVAKTGQHPLPKAPSITLFRRKAKDDEDDDEPAPSNGRRNTGIGP